MTLYGLIGHPLAHSFSATYFAEKFKEQNITHCEYRNFDIPSIELFSDLVEAHRELSGLNVTIPYKETIIPFLDELDPEAKLIGAVNCIKILENGRKIGYNTDAYGFYHSIKPFLENKSERALILGTGGSSKAVGYVLQKLGIQVFFASTNPSKSNHVSYGDITADAIKHFPLIINTTPLGTFPNVETAPELPYEALTDKHFLFDLTYNPEENSVLEKKAKRPVRNLNGKLMLQLQAEKIWSIWNS
ncbi:MAG: shikimate dehydrogenase [Flavobacteriales bacterium]